jgi:chorismate mutase
MHSPGACASLAAVRAEIDRLDDQIVPLLAERGGYVLAAATAR